LLFVSTNNKGKLCAKQKPAIFGSKKAFFVKITSFVFQILNFFGEF